MPEILIATLIIGVIGLVLGLALVTASKKFYVESDDRVVRVRECLRGSNCGACGFAGCDACAEAIVSGKAHVDACPGNATQNIAKIAAILGKESVKQDPQVAFIRCGGDCDAAKKRGEYVGITDCRAAVLTGIPITGCDNGCLGFGSCAAVCPQKAISVVNGVAVVDPSKCVGCGLCAKACPKHLVEMLPREASVVVRCSNHEKGPSVKKNCANGCIGCGICQKQCINDAVHVEANLASVDHSKCVACGKCMEKCPTKAIRSR